MPEDAAAISEVLTAAGIAAWSAFLGAERIYEATRGRHHPRAGQQLLHARRPLVRDLGVGATELLGSNGCPE